MKESDITPRVIELSKAIAEYWRMEIYEGCWFYCTWGGGHLFLMAEEKHTCEERGHDIYPIPSISDVYSEVNRRKYTIDLIQDHGNSDNEHFNEANIVHANLTEGWRGIGKTPHIALLSAFLSMLKGEQSDGK